MSQDWGDAAVYALMIVLPLSALAARRLPIGTTLKMIVALVAIFVLGILLVVFARDPAARAWRSLTSGMSNQSVTGRTVRIRIANDGHFWADATVNGVPRRMLIDSGATTTAISVGTATAARLALDDSPFPALLDTANGQIAAKVATVHELTIGPIVARDLGVVVAPEFGDTDLLGMNFLSKLRGWRVEGDSLVLEVNP